jgi:hypothetical protein
MKALDLLAQLLRGSLDVADRPFPVADNFGSIIAALQRHNKTGCGNCIPDDLQHAAVRNFWDSRRFDTLKDARLVSFGMCLPVRNSGPCIMEDRQRFAAVLDAKTGVDQWIDDPRWYRRCYQGLMRSYFMYDANSMQASAVAKENWADLRCYLNKRTQNIVDKKVNPDWVTTVRENCQLFSEAPCSPYAEQVLSEDTTKIDQLCEQLGISKASWFLRDLVLAQVRQATRYGHNQFKELIPRLLALLADNQVLRDKGLILMLDKYVAASQPEINEPLREASVSWWGNPWLPSNEARWGGVVPAALEMVEEWLKREFVEAFFTKLAEDGVGDRRRANFWLRYLKSMANIRFALGAHALSSRDPDFVALRKKMNGLYTGLRTTVSTNNAFIMTLGDLVVVEFGDGGALYGYDGRKDLPFDPSPSLSLGTAVDGSNSLKQSSRILWLRHQDGRDRWEDMFAAALQKQFGIEPDVHHQRTAARRAVSPSPQRINQRPSPNYGARSSQSETAFNNAAFSSLVKKYNLKVEDNRDRNGNLWVRTDSNYLPLSSVLKSWGFEYKPGKGWWR